MASARSDNRNRSRGTRRVPQKKQAAGLRDLPYTKKNAIVFGAGMLVILLGYLCLAQPPVDGFLSLSLAPVLLVIGYCVLIPLALLMGGSDSNVAHADGAAEDTGD
ncbi:MAG: hypothetical protein O2954_01345 [bacterium]|nr:hypothetical protein [bacterium]